MTHRCIAFSLIISLSLYGMDRLSSQDKINDINEHLQMLLAEKSHEATIIKNQDQAKALQYQITTLRNLLEDFNQDIADRRVSVDEIIYHYRNEFKKNDPHLSKDLKKTIKRIFTF